MSKKILTLLLVSLNLISLSSCSTIQSSLSQNDSSSKSILSLAGSLAEDSPLWHKDPETIWNKLQHVSLQKLQAMKTTDPLVTGWIKLAILSKEDSNNTTRLAKDLQVWRDQYPSHPGNKLFPDNASLSQLLQSTTAPHHIALLLPLDGPLGKQGKTVRDGFLNAYYANLSSKHLSQTVSFYDTNENQNITALYQKALNDGADFIVGPLTKENVQSLQNHGGINAPTLALNYTDLWLGSLPTNFYQFGLSPLDEAEQVADKAREDGHSSAIIIVSENDWGKRVVKSLSSRWQSNGGSIKDVLYVSPKTNVNQAVSSLFRFNTDVDKNITQEDNNKRIAHEGRRDFDVVFLLTPPQTARSVVPLIKYYYVNNVAVYSTSIINSGSRIPQDVDLNGVIFSDTPSAVFNTGGNSSRLYAVGVDAYELSQELPRLTALSHFPIYGKTGALTLNTQHQIYRRLPWTTMHDGHP